jgi:prepilin-type processing-associated H-X9-DG protein
MGINLGAFVSPLVCGYLGQRVNWHAGFAAAGFGMVLGLVQYVLGSRHLGDAGIKAWWDPQKQRVISYGLNGMLICSPAASQYTGDAATTMKQNEAGGNNAPAPLSTSTVSDPAGTILFAELATEAAVTGFTTANPPDPLPGTVATGGDGWNSAIVEWIDISPRHWVETSGANSYIEDKWDTTKGVARDFYGGGGNYAFVDGHVKFYKLAQTVGLGQYVTPATGGQYQVTAGNNAWRVDNIYNLWNPNR